MLGTLYVVATPIGNLEDISLRAMRILSEVDVILAEDTRVTAKLLDFLFNQKPISNNLQQTKPKVLSYHQHSSEEKKLEILNFLMNGKNVALVTDAGTPGVSDPGNELIDYLLSFQPELNVIPIPGASSVTVALSICGFNVSKFTFIGFLPKKKGKKTLEEALVLNIPVVFFESPYRIIKTLISLKDLKHEPRRVFIAQELTKLHERTFRGNVKDAVTWMEGEVKKLGRIKGEIVVILEP
jgi:16S rRNA (cytidine1402-2'-O)-methyltransferase